jgi:phosphatidylethanolamine/phosphatidyl-N-methylethanolamine N-methyltransferase
MPMSAEAISQNPRETVPMGTGRDNLLFFRSWLQDPLRAGAFKPSSPDLARAMADRVDPAIPGPVVELGPGTGAITRALIERGVDPARLVLVEADPNFCALLQQRWPMARVLQGDAYAAPMLMRRFDQPAAAVVAGLPLLVRPPAQRLRLVTDCLRHAVPGAPFVQFTYFVRSPVPAPRPGLRAHGSGMVWRNLWPARVWTYRLPRRRADAA